jgi:hypothetical protein
MRYKLTLTITLALVALAFLTPVTFTHALATLIVSDDFNANSIDTTKWDPNNLAFGPTNTSISIAQSGHNLKIGPLLQNTSGFNYRGISTVNTYNFTGASAYVELVQAAASNTNGEAAFAVGSDFNDCYRMYVSGGNLIGQLRKASGRGAVEISLFSIPYDSTNHRFLRIRNDSGSLFMDTAPGSGGVPGTWTQQYTESWEPLVSTSAVVFEIKGGTSQAETNPPGKVIFDNFVATTP